MFYELDPSPTTADAKTQPSVEEVMDCMDNYFGDSRFEVPWDILDRGELRDRLTKLFKTRPTLTDHE
jgi:hypothetical protein